MTKKNKRRGFTVVELVIVIAVIAILAAVLIPTYANLVKKANEAKAQAEAKNLITEMLADILLGKEGDADLLVFSEKGSDVYAYAYSRTEGKIIAYKDNPTAKTGSFENTVQSILTAMGDAITDCNVAEDDWRHPNKIKAVVNELNTKGTMIVYANYTINADKFAVHVHSFGAWENADAENHIRKCSCGETETEAHKWDNGVVTKEATEGKSGTKTYTCTICNATKTEVVSGGETHHLFHHVAKAATCGEAGNIEYWECVDEGCGKYFSDSNATNEITDKNSVKIAKLTNHTYGAWNNTTQATCTTDGRKQRTCTVCGHTEDGTIPATGHTSSDWIVDKEPAVGAAGSKHKECTVCHTRLETAEIPALPAPEKTAIEKANEAIKAYTDAGGKITTMHDAISVLDKATKDSIINADDVLWDSRNNVFCKTADVGERAKIEFWKITKKTLDRDYNNYLADGYEGTEITALRTGLDVGNNENIEKITYSPYTAITKINVVIRTNGGSLNIDKGIVTHYGTAESVTLGRAKEINSTTYTENGKVNGIIKVYKSDMTVNKNSDTENAARAVVICKQSKSGSTRKVVVNDNTPVCISSSFTEEAAKTIRETDITAKNIVADRIILTGMAKFTEGLGTKNSPFVVDSADKLSEANSLTSRNIETLYFKLGADITTKNNIISLAENTKIVLDLNKKTLTICPNDGTIQIGSKGLTIIGSGSITQSNGMDNGVFSFLNNGASLTIENGTFNGKYLVGKCKTGVYSGTVTINGGTLNVVEHVDKTFFDLAESGNVWTVTSK